LCALFLKPHDEHEDHKKKNFLQRFYAAFNRGFNATIHRYGKSLHFLYKHKWITAVILILSAVGIWWTSTTTPTGFVPNEDRGIVFANVELPAGSSLDKTHEITGELYNKVKDLPGVEGLNMVDGFSLLNGQGSNYALGFIKLKDWSQREEDSLSADAITGQLFGIASTIPDANIIFFAPPSIPGFSASSGVEVNLLVVTLKNLTRQIRSLCKT
jgi:HAE1 family hydrophobic/amphiphilic exporter-1